MVTVAQQLRSSQNSLKRRLNEGVNKPIMRTQKSLALRLGSVTSNIGDVSAIDTANTLGFVDAPGIRRRSYGNR